MDPLVAQYLMQKGLVPQNMSLPGLPDPQQPPPVTMPDGTPPPEDTASPSDPSTPQAAPPQAATAPKPSMPTPPDTSQFSTLSDDDMKRYGIQSPDQIAALQQQRMQMGNDLAGQANGNAIAKMLMTSSDLMNTTGNRILAGNVSNTAKAGGEALDQALAGQQAKVTALDDSNKMGNPNFDRLTKIDDTRLKLKEQADTANFHNQYIKQMHDQTNATKDAYRQQLENDKDNKENDQIMNEMNNMKASSRSAVGIAAQGKMAANRLITIVNDPKATVEDLNNAAADMSRLVTQSSTISGAEGQQYSSLASTLSHGLQFIASAPNSPDVPQIKQHMAQVAQRMQDISQNVIKQNSQFVKTGHQRYDQRYPGRIESMVEKASQMGDMQGAPTEMKQIGNTKYKKTAAGWEQVD